MRKRKHVPAGAGQNHPASKLTEVIVIQLRRTARERSQSRGWMRRAAEQSGVSVPTIVYAVAGKTWRYLNHREPPVPKGQRCRPVLNPTRTAPLCPYCKRRKSAAREWCRNRFHEIDHRAYSSPRNLKAYNARRKLLASHRA